MSDILKGLGKATKRGIRRCPKCGTLNGNRGVSCKNRTCDMVFKEHGKQLPMAPPQPPDPPPEITATRLVVATPANVSVFALKSNEKALNRNQRGFAVLVTQMQQQMEEEEQQQGEEAAAEEEEASADLSELESLLRDGHGYPEQQAQQAQSSSAAAAEFSEEEDSDQIVWPKARRCFLLPCRDGFGPTPCPHLEHCMQRADIAPTAQPLRVKLSVLNDMAIDSNLKQEIWLGARRNGPLVQRVSETTMVVKCNPQESAHPLGLLHVLFPDLSSENAPMWHCSCSVEESELNVATPCIHFYSCIAVFASDEKLAQEFSFFIALQQEISGQELTQVITILDPAGEGITDASSSVTVEVMTEDQLTLMTQQQRQQYPQQVQYIQQEQNMDNIRSGEQEAVVLGESGGQFSLLMPQRNAEVYEEVTTAVQESVLRPAVQEQVTPNHYSLINESLALSSAITNKEEEPAPPAKKKKPPPRSSSKRPSEKPKEICSLEPFSFLHWLSGVTESINATQHYGCEEAPAPLRFVIPETYFQSLRERLSWAGKRGRDGKARLPDAVNPVRRTTPPVGAFVKYTWRMTSLAQLREVFQTPLVSLAVAKSFKPKADGSMEEISLDAKGGSNNFLTFLKVGKLSNGEAVPGFEKFAFVIDWTPETLPKSQMGELVIQFNFGTHPPCLNII